MRNFILILLLCSASGFSQERKHFVYKDEALSIVLFDIEKQFDVKFSYMDELVVDRRISLANKEYSLSELIDNLRQITGFLFQKIDKRYFAIFKKEEKDATPTHFLEEVVLQGYLTKGITKQKEANFTILPNRLELLPGLTEPDVLQILQQLPGVISPNETATGLHVRGGTPDQNLILFDGITMYQNGHLFGMISGFNPNSIASVKFYNKGTNAIYGGRVSSVIDLKTTDKIPEKTKLLLGINALNADVLLNTPIIKDKMNMQVSARRSFTDLYPSYTYKSLAAKVFQNTKLSNVNTSDNRFYFQDYSARINFQLSKNNSMSLSSIIINNDLDNTYTESVPNILKNDRMDISNTGYSLSWKHRWNTRFSQKLLTHYSKYSLNYTYKKSYDLANYDLFVKRNRILDSGFSLENEYHLNSKQHLDFGYQLSAYDVSHIFKSQNPSLSFILDTNAAFLLAHSLYASYHYEVSPKIDMHTGLRYNYYSSLHQSVVEPRLVLNYNMTKKFSFNITGEIKNQIISQIKETVVSDLNLENQLWVLSDQEKRPVINAKQLTFGAIYRKNHWTIDWDVYHKHTTGLTTLTLGFLNNLDPNLHLGESDSKGVDFYIKKNFHALQTWLTYSFNDTQTKFEGINKNRYFPYNSEIRHSVNFSMAYKLNRFQLAMGWYWRTGKPYTRIDILNNTIQYDEINEEQLAPYHRLDLSALYRFKLSKEKDHKGKVGFSIYNVYNQKNLLNREYSVDQSIGNQVELRDKYGLRFTPNIFLRVDL